MSGGRTENSGAKRWWMIGAAIVLAIALISTLPVGAWLEALRSWMVGLGPIGYVLFALTYAVCCVLFVPASVLTLGAGAAYGLGRGFAVVLAGASLGAIASFLLARTWLRARVEQWTAGNARFRALDRAIAREGAKIVFLVRLSPIFPFTYINYGFGLTGIPLGSYALATVIGMIPGTFAYVYLGAAAAGVASGDTATAKLAVQAVGAFAALAVTVFVARLAARAIRSAGVEEGDGNPRTEGGSGATPA